MKNFILFFALLSFLKAEPSLDELADFTPMFAIRSLETGISLSPFRKTSKRLEDQNWFLKEIVANDELKARDMHAKDLPFGYVQFISPRGDDICLAVLSEKVLAPNLANKICKMEQCRLFFLSYQ